MILKHYKEICMRDYSEDAFLFSFGKPISLYGSGVVSCSILAEKDPVEVSIYADEQGLISEEQGLRFDGIQTIMNHYGIDCEQMNAPGEIDGCMESDYLDEFCMWVRDGNCGIILMGSRIPTRNWMCRSNYWTLNAEFVAVTKWDKVYGLYCIDPRGLHTGWHRTQDWNSRFPDSINGNARIFYKVHTRWIDETVPFYASIPTIKKPKKGVYDSGKHVLMAQRIFRARCYTTSGFNVCPTNGICDEDTWIVIEKFHKECGGKFSLKNGAGKSFWKELLLGLRELPEICKDDNGVHILFAQELLRGMGITYRMVGNDREKIVLSGKCDLHTMYACEWFSLKNKLWCDFDTNRNPRLCFWECLTEGLY